MKREFTRVKCDKCGQEPRLKSPMPGRDPFECGCTSLKKTDDTRQTRTFEVTIPCPHCRRLLDVFLKEAS